MPGMVGARRQAANRIVMLRFLVNFLAGGAWVLFFNWLGWIQLAAGTHLVADPGFGHLVDAGIIAFIAMILGELIAFGYKVFVVVTLGLGCLLLPFYWLLAGYIKLSLTALILPWFTYNHNLLLVLIMSWALGAARWHIPGEIALRQDNSEE
jgi:hypothetical protein